MAPLAKPAAQRETPQNRRERLRSQGLRPIEIRVPDVHAPTFHGGALRQSMAVGANAQDDVDQAFIDAISDRDCG